MSSNPISIGGGILMILSPFLAWTSTIGISLSLFDAVRTALADPSLIATAFQIDFLAGIGQIFVILAFFLLIIGGITAFFNGVKGGGLGILAMFLHLFNILAVYNLLQGTAAGFSFTDLFSFLGIGYYLAWIASIIAIIGGLVFKKETRATIVYTPPPP